MKSVIEQKLAELNLVLPVASAPVANFVPFTVCGSQVMISGQLPVKDGKMMGVGKLGKNISIEEGQAVARQCGLNLLSHLKVACGGDLGRVKNCLKLGVFVNSTEDFTDHPQVANGVSDLMVALLGEHGKHARFAMGAAQLPFGVAVEVDGVFEIN